MRKITYWLTLVLIFTVPMENIVSIPGLGRVSKIAGLVVAVFWIATVLNSGRFRKPHPFHLVVLLYVIWNALSIFWSVDPNATVPYVRTFVQLFVMVYIIWEMVTTHEALRPAIQAYILGAWITAGSLIASYLLYGAAEYQRRFTVGTFQLNDVGLIIALGIHLAVYMAVAETSGPLSQVLRWINLAYIPTAIVTVMFTGDRAATVGILPALWYVLFSVLRIRISVRMLGLAAVVAGLFVLMLPLIPEKTIGRLSTVSQIAGGDLGGRGVLWREAFETFTEHPLLGVGAGAYRTSAGKLTHNLSLDLLAELGVVGFGLFWLILFMAAKSVRAKKEFKGLWWSLLTTWLVGAHAYNFEDKKQTWLFLGLIVASAVLPERRAAGREATGRDVDLQLSPSGLTTGTPVASGTSP